MNKDRKAIITIISDMLDNPDSSGIYPTSTCYTRLEHYIEQVRLEAIAWGHTDACITLDKGLDPRTAAVPDLIQQALKDLSN